MTRREALQRSVALFAFSTVAGSGQQNGNDASTILARIKPPQFSNRDFDITHFGAVAGGEQKCTEAIRKAIQSCSRARGGRVVVPPGSFLTGAIHLESNVNLHLSEGATLLFSKDPKDYLPLVFTRFESTELMNYSPFIYAFEKQNVAVTGPGMLDGQADPDHWWPWAKKARGGVPREQGVGASDVKTLVEEMGNKDVPVSERIFGEGHYLRPNFVQPYRCTNVLLEGFSIKNSPMWELNPTLCTNVTVRNVKIDSHGPNNDGCDPDACRDVLIENCTFSTGDDCIAIKAGRNRDGRRVGVACENIIVRNCVMEDGHGGVSIGSEVSGGIRNVYTENCKMSSPHLQRALRIKTNSYRGGVIENVQFTNVTVGEVAESVIEVDFYYEEGEGGQFKPIVKDVYVADVTCQKSKYAIYFRGYANDAISGVTLSNCVFNNAGKGEFLQNVQGVTLKNVTVNGRPLTDTEIRADQKS